MTAPVITSDVLSVDAYEGTTALLPCDTAGDPLPTIKWYRDGKSLPGKDTRFHQLPNGALQITALRSSDSGSYRCVASNKAGTEEQTVELTVKAVETKGRLSGWSGLGNYLKFGSLLRTEIRLCVISQELILQVQRHER